MSAASDSLSNLFKNEDYVDVTPYVYDSESGEWAKRPWDPEPVNIDLSTLTVVTYNVWFGDTAFEGRAQALIKIMEDSDADVIALQEVTTKFMPFLTSSKVFQDNYWISDATGRTLGSYGVIVLSRLPVSWLQTRFFPTYMGRNLVRAGFMINGQRLYVSTAHFESLTYRDMRKMQLTVAGEFTRDAPTSIIMGDFNFDSVRNFRLSDPTPCENAVLAEVLPEFVDVWPTLYPNHTGITFNSTVNKMLFQTEHMRYDRVMLRSQEWFPVSMEILGTKPITEVIEVTDAVKADIYANVWPSDHFGLRAVFSVDSEAAANAEPPASLSDPAANTPYPESDDVSGGGGGGGGGGEEEEETVVLTLPDSVKNKASE